MSPLNVVGILCALTIPHINCNFPQPQPDISLNTISSTPFPPDFGKDSVSGSYSGSGSGSSSSSFSSSGSYSSGVKSFSSFGSGGSASGQLGSGGAISGFIVSPGAQTIGANGKVWYLDSNSPFKVAPLKQCNLCAAAAAANGGNAGEAHTGHAEAHKAVFGGEYNNLQKMDISKNPFLTGQVPAVSPDQIPHVDIIKVDQTVGSASSSSVDISKNPFLTGKVPVPVAQGCSGSSCGGNIPAPVAGCSGASCGGQASAGCASGSCTGSTQTLTINKNPFLGGNAINQADSGYKFTGQIPLPNVPKVSGNPFLNGPLDTGYKFPGQGLPLPPQPSQSLSTPKPDYAYQGVGIPQQPSLVLSTPKPPQDGGFKIPAQKPQGFSTSIPQPQKPQGFATSIPQAKPPGFATSIPQQQFDQSQFQQQFDQTQQQQFDQTQQQRFDQTQQQQFGISFGNNGQVATDKGDDELTVGCGKTGFVCVPKAECVNGKVTKFGEGLLQVRSSLEYCKVNSEVCCELDSATIAKQQVTRGVQGNQGSGQFQLNNNFVSQGTKVYTSDAKGEIFAQNPLFGPTTAGSFKSNGITQFNPNPQNTLFPGSKSKGPQYLPPYPNSVSPQPEPELIPPYSPEGSNTNSVTDVYPTKATPKPYIPPKPTTPKYLPPPPPTSTPKSNNGYLPPLIGDGSNIDNQKVPLPSNEFGTFLPRPTPPRPLTNFDALPSGCPAALICVEDDFCSADGVASETRVSLTQQQQESRVPTTSCTIAGGKSGKCCRDPNYKDPWPVGQLGLWNPNDGFDDGSYKQGSSPTRNVVPRPQPQPRPVQPQPPRNIGNRQPVDLDFAGSGQCAIRDRNVRPRGNIPLDANFAEIPWQAMILRDTNRSLLCGGVIISDNAVLTAAHCVQGFPTNDILVKGGEWRLGVDEEPKPFQIVKVGAIVIHPRYDAQRQLNDLALLFLSEKFRFDQHIQPICILDDKVVEAVYPNADCITSGWGKDVLKIHIQNALMHQMDLNFIQKSDCQAQIQQRYPENLYRYDGESCLCAQPKVPEYTVCDVDQGSALACDVGNGVYLLAGIYSWDTEGCTNAQNEIAAFARLDTKWIYEFLAKPVQQIFAEYGASSNQQVSFVPVKGGVKGGIGGVKGGFNGGFNNGGNPFFQAQQGGFGSFSHNVPVIQPAPHEHIEGVPCQCAQGAQ